MTPLIGLRRYGQNYWLDNLTRDMIRDGSLAHRVHDEDLSGVTSNPAIFAKAISKGHAYDEQIQQLFAAGMPPDQIYEELTTTDVRDACDILRSAYERSEEAEGYVSIEVSPHLARDTRASIEEARKLHKKVDRPNLFIKIPGTREGVPAIEQLLYEGIDVNVTLLFSIAAYEAVADAYMRALERRLAEDKPIRSVTSVASFFLSRIDTLVDQRLTELVDDRRESNANPPPLPQSLLGKVAIANAKLAYQAFLNILGSERWQRLAEQGAQPQRMVWASTSAKNPRYSDTLYVDPLIGPNTINTMPEKTIDAFRDHGRIGATVEQDVEAARRVMDELSRLEIDFAEIAGQLEEEGIRKFAEPFDQVLQQVASKRGG